MSNKTTTDGNQEQSFSILPHPAVSHHIFLLLSHKWRFLQKTNDPADLQRGINPADPQKFQQGGLGVFNTPGPVIPKEGALPQPLVGFSSEDEWMVVDLIFGL